MKLPGLDLVPTWSAIAIKCLPNESSEALLTMWLGAIAEDLQVIRIAARERAFLLPKKPLSTQNCRSE
jgi:hypothetical protein